ncbi:L-aspartate oxidase [Glycocaulis sp.]|uniref:L-aspartate oxidase n=1 Tax=Glycocaulis sp. TaxID=1969725 RepID=UPI0025C2D5D1|nr:L-aspartate oxidase [Glycocaulis sp.]MCH8521677.1 L-aspartate oxidase [Glycocaulis sp.]
MSHPLIIIGAGIAGLWTALHAAPRRVILLTGARLGEGSSTGWAQGGVAAALGTDDRPSLHARDTIAAGAGLVYEAAAYLLAEAGPAEIEALYGLGAPFEREADGSWSLSREAAHSRARVARVKGDQAGAGILAALIRAVQAAPHIEIREGWRASGLIPDAAGGCAGVMAFDPSGNLHDLLASDVVLATGSLCGLYGVTTTPASSQGQALSWAARLGAVIQDPEFVQFHPTAIDVGRDPAPLATEALRGEGATLIDRTGTRFMRGVHPQAELAPRDVVARAVHRQVKTGRGAYLDARAAVGAEFPERFPAVFAACRAAGIDPRLAPIPVAPAAHYHMGGVAADTEGFTGVPGLWAVGECASTGVHGANRLASNSLLEGLVFGRRAAEALANAPQRALKPVPADPAPALPAEALARLRAAMAIEAGVEREAAGLARLLDTINALEAKHGEADALIAARFVAAGAMLRTESRGGHFRSDHPSTSAVATHTRLTLAEARAVHPHISPLAEPAE